MIQEKAIAHAHQRSFRDLSLELRNSVISAAQELMEEIVQEPDVA